MIRLYAALILALAALIIGAMSARALDFPHNMPGLLDRYELHQIEDWHMRLEYVNVWPPNSTAPPESLGDGDREVLIDVQWGGGPEVLTVTPPAGWIAIPETISVEDGSTGWIDLYRRAPGM